MTIWRIEENRMSFLKTLWKAAPAVLRKTLEVIAVIRGK